jgi:hypothetical protein
MKPQNASLIAYITTLQMSGRYTFTRDEALHSLQITPEAFKLAAMRLIKKTGNVVHRLINGFCK